MEKRERVDGGENSHDDYHNIWTKAYPSLAPHSLALPAHPMVAQALPPASQRGDNSDFGLAFRRGVFRFFARPLNFKVVPVRYFVRIWRPPGTGKGQGQLLSKTVCSLAFWNQQLKAVREGARNIGLAQSAWTKCASWSFCASCHVHPFLHISCASLRNATPGLRAPPVAMSRHRR